SRWARTRRRLGNAGRTTLESPASPSAALRVSRVFETGTGQSPSLQDRLMNYLRRLQGARPEFRGDSGRLNAVTRAERRTRHAPGCSSHQPSLVTFFLFA